MEVPSRKLKVMGQKVKDPSQAEEVDFYWKDLREAFKIHGKDLELGFWVDGVGEIRRYLNITQSE